jgi:hypothetical protein
MTIEETSEDDVPQFHVFPSSGEQVDRPGRRRQVSYDPRTMQRFRQTFVEPEDKDMMGPLVRRKKVVSVPLGATGEDFFGQPSPRPGAIPGNPSPHASPRANRPKRTSNLSFGAVLRRKQVSLDIYAGSEADFFPEEFPELEMEPILATPAESIDEALAELPEPEPELSQEQAQAKDVPLFLPLRFSPPVTIGAGTRVRHDHEVNAAAPPPIQEGTVVDDELRNALNEQDLRNRELRTQFEMLMDRLEGETDQEQEKLFEDIRETQGEIEKCALGVRSKIHPDENPNDDKEEDTDETAAIKPTDDGIIRATRIDYIWTGVLLCVMIAFTCVIVFWETHLDESSSSFGPVGLACATPCDGDLVSQDYFFGHSHFETGQYVQLIMQLDPNQNDVEAIVTLVGAETGQVKAEFFFGPPSDDAITNFKQQIEVDFDNPHEEHIINVASSDSDVVITYKLHASVLSHLAGKSELIAALIMIFVYMFILLEVIHRTLVAIFGSMVALFFFFLIHMVSFDTLLSANSKPRS